MLRRRRTVARRPPRVLQRRGTVRSRSISWARFCVAHVKRKPYQHYPNMRRQPYFPRVIAERVSWFENYAQQIPLANATLGLLPADVTNSVNDAGFCQYATGAWLTAVRDFGPATTAAVNDLYSGSGGGTFALPVFTPPVVPPAVGNVPPGALDRIFGFVQSIKASPNYTEAIGLQLRVVGQEAGGFGGVLVIPGAQKLLVEVGYAHVAAGVGGGASRRSRATGSRGAVARARSQQGFRSGSLFRPHVARSGACA